MPETATFTALYNNTPATSGAAIYTATQGTAIHQILGINTTGSAATITLTLVRKGGTTSDAYATQITGTGSAPVAFSVPAGDAVEFLAGESLQSEYGEIVLEAGDEIYGSQGTSSAITLIMIGH
jgi:hypothetical protein